MSTQTGTTIRCDRYGCDHTVFGETAEVARERAHDWTQTEDGRDFCWSCSKIRAERRPLRDLIPAGVRLMRAFDAAEAAGFERRDENEAEGTAHFYCCGQEVEVASFLGDAYHAECMLCNKAISSVLGPAFSNSAVAFPDNDKVDTEDPNCQGDDPEGWVPLAAGFIAEGVEGVMLGRAMAERIGRAFGTSTELWLRLAGEMPSAEPVRPVAGPSADTRRLDTLEQEGWAVSFDATCDEDEAWEIETHRYRLHVAFGSDVRAAIDAAIATGECCWCGRDRHHEIHDEQSVAMRSEINESDPDDLHEYSAAQQSETGATVNVEGEADGK